MPYDERMVAPMRAELTRLGLRELRTVDDVDGALKAPEGTTLVVVNSVCGCSARNARPAIALALGTATAKRPSALTTVFAGQDMEATARARSYLAPYPPSSPMITLLKDGKVAFMLERKDIERRDAAAIAADLARAFEEHC